MEKKKWSRKYEKCRECGTTEKIHEAKGFCSTCYYKRRYYKIKNLVKPKSKKINVKWSQLFEKCIDCGTTKKEHNARGLCTACYDGRKIRGTLPPKKPRPWSMHSEKCVSCGKTKYKHSSKGMCRYCYDREYRKTERGAKIYKNSVKKYCASEYGRKRRRELRRLWLSQNRELYRNSKRHRREKEYGIDVLLPVGYEELIFNVFGYKCVSCGESKRTLQLDHHNPLQEGNQLLHNAVPLCKSCNSRKNRKDPKDFYNVWTLTLIKIHLFEVRQLYEERFGRDKEEECTKSS